MSRVTRVVVERWSAWAPDCEDPDAWRAWAANPAPLQKSGHPEAKFLPAMLRRRCNPLTRIMLTAAFACSDPDAGEPRTVFASRHGSINDSIELLESISLRKKISPAVFSHTVQNAQAGLFSIATHNRRASSSVSAQRDTFASAFVEALTHLDREPDLRVLLVVGDVPLVPVLAPLVSEVEAPHALALRLALSGSGTALGFEVGAESIVSPELGWPEPIEFLRWLLSSESQLSFGSGRGCYTWSRL